MVKFLINLASFVVCVGILAFGGYQTVQQNNFNEMMEEMDKALASGPILPENPDQGGDIDPENPDQGGSSTPENPDQGGSSTPENPDQGGDSTPVDPDQGGSSTPENPDQGGSTTPVDPDQGGSSTPENPDQGGSSTPENPDQGGSSTPENPDQGGSGTPENPGEDPETPENPENPENPDQGGNEGGNTPSSPTLSTDDAMDAFGNLYDNSDPTFNDVNRELFVGMVSGFFGSSNSDSGNTPEEPEVPEEPDDSGIYDDNFSTDFNPDEFVPDEEPEEDSGEAQLEDVIVDIAGTYYENLQNEIQNNQQANQGATAEEQQAARDEFVQKEAEAFAGLINVVTKPEETSDEDLVQSVDAVLNSNVCLGTVTDSIGGNEELNQTVQDATANINEETKAEIENKINAALEANPEKEQQYNDLANLFGITLGGAQTPEIPGDVDIPEDFNPEDYV